MTAWEKYNEAVKQFGNPWWANWPTEFKLIYAAGKYKALAKTNAEAKPEWEATVLRLIDGITNSDPRNIPYIPEYQRQLALYHAALDHIGPATDPAPNPKFDPTKPVWNAIPFYNFYFA